MNSIYRNIEVTTEVPENFRDDKLPVLDFKCWVDNTKKVYTAGTGTERPIETRRILYTFFEKDMSSKFAIMKTSALPEKTKISSLSNDLMRRMKNVSEDLDQKTRNEVVDAYAKRLILSGYKQEQVREIVVAGLKGYEKVVTMAKEGKTMIHRSAASSAASRYKKKLTGKSTWFLDKAKSEKEDNKENGQPQKQGNAKNGKIANLEDKQQDAKKTVTVLFTMQTPNGQLATRIRGAEQELAELCDNKVKIVERSGKTMKSLLI